MVQAARSGVRNSGESVVSATSKKTGIKLTNVARASLEELMRNYEDFLRQRGLQVWHKDSPKGRKLRERMASREEEAVAHIRTVSTEIAANMLLVLINHASFLLRRQISSLERAFVEHGGTFAGEKFWGCCAFPGCRGTRPS
jgi:four helix bundle suffix protein